MKPRMMSPTTDILTTPKPESLKTPKFRDFGPELHAAAGLAGLRSPRDVDSLNTPLALTTPHGLTDPGSLSTPTLTTPRTADWGLFSPNLGSNCSSPRDSLSARDNRPADLPLDSSIGLSSPHDGVLAKRRKLKNLSSSHSRSVESDSNSCDTPTDGGITLAAAAASSAALTAADVPRDLSKKSSDRDKSPSSTTNDLDTVRDRVGDVKLSSPKWFKHPKHLPHNLQLNKELLSEMPASYHPSPLAVPSPNWTAIKELLSNSQTPKVLDNFVFDVLPPNTPTAKSYRERSPEISQSQPINYEKHGKADTTEHRLKSKMRQCPPSPPTPVDLSNPNKTFEAEKLVKQEYDPDAQAEQSGHHYHQRHTPPSPPPYPEDQVKVEPREYPQLPPDFPPYYLPQLAGQHLYPRQSEHTRPSSPPASPPRSGATNHFQHRPPPQFYESMRHAHALSSLYEPQHAHTQYNSSVWGHDMGHVTMPTPGQNQHPWSRIGQSHCHANSSGSDTVSSSVASINMQNYVNSLKPSMEKLQVKTENRLSTDSQDSFKKKSRKLKQEEAENGDLDSSVDGQPPKKKGKGKGKNVKDPNAPKRSFTCPHCNVSKIL